MSGWEASLTRPAARPSRAARGPRRACWRNCRRPPHPGSPLHGIPPRPASADTAEGGRDNRTLAAFPPLEGPVMRDDSLDSFLTAHLPALRQLIAGTLTTVGGYYATLDAAATDRELRRVLVQVLIIVRR